MCWLFVIPSDSCTIKETIVTTDLFRQVKLFLVSSLIGSDTLDKKEDGTRSTEG